MLLSDADKFVDVVSFVGGTVGSGERVVGVAVDDSCVPFEIWVVALAILEVSSLILDFLNCLGLVVPFSFVVAFLTSVFVLTIVVGEMLSTSSRWGAIDVC